MKMTQYIDHSLKFTPPKNMYQIIAASPDAVFFCGRKRSDTFANVVMCAIIPMVLIRVNSVGNTW